MLVHSSDTDFKAHALVSKDTYFPALTGIRAIAAFLVFISHFNPFNERIATQKWAFDFVHQGHFGVPIFFVLSGFLIATRYMNRVEPTWQWLRKYMKNRVARIYPIYFLLTTITFVVYQFNPYYDAIGLWAHYKMIDKVLVVLLNFTFLRGFFANFFFSGISQGWSLTAEETFYILAPSILLTTKGHFRLLLAWSTSLLTAGWLLATVFSPYATPLFGFFGSIEFMFQWTFFGHTLEFMMGMGLAIFISRESRTHKEGNLITCIGIVWIIACAVLIATLEQKINYIHHEHLKILTINFLLPPGICLLFYGLLRESTFVRRVLSTSYFDLLGKSSYAFYLIHLGVLSVALHKLEIPMLLSLGVTIALSILLFKAVEEPLHRYIRNLS